MTVPLLQQIGHAEAQTTAEYRYERKFLVEALHRDSLELLVRLHPALFSDLFHPRFVNNIYLDSVGHASYIETMEGARDRTKIRVRWYGALLGRIEQPVLELKIKRGFLGRKESFPLPAFVLDEHFNADAMTRVFRSCDLPAHVAQHLRTLAPTLLNRYLRTYHQSADKRFRITIDTGLEYYALYLLHNTFQHRVVDPVHSVLELKYEREHDDAARHISNYFPFRVTKSSKYVMGLAALNTW